MNPIFQSSITNEMLPSVHKKSPVRNFFQFWRSSADDLSESHTQRINIDPFHLGDEDLGFFFSSKKVSSPHFETNKIWCSLISQEILPDVLGWWDGNTNRNSHISFPNLSVEVIWAETVMAARRLICQLHKLDPNNQLFCASTSLPNSLGNGEYFEDLRSLSSFISSRLPGDDFSWMDMIERSVLSHCLWAISQPSCEFPGHAIAMKVLENFSSFALKEGWPLQMPLAKEFPNSESVDLPPTIPYSIFSHRKNSQRISHAIKQKSISHSIILAAIASSLKALQEIRKMDEWNLIHFSFKNYIRYAGGKDSVRKRPDTSLTGNSPDMTEFRKSVADRCKKLCVIDLLKLHESLNAYIGKGNLETLHYQGEENAQEYFSGNMVTSVGWNITLFLSVCCGALEDHSEKFPVNFFKTFRHQLQSMRLSWPRILARMVDSISTTLWGQWFSEGSILMPTSLPIECNSTISTPTVPADDSKTEKRMVIETIRNEGINVLNDLRKLDAEKWFWYPTYNPLHLRNISFCIDFLTLEFLLNRKEPIWERSSGHVSGNMLPLSNKDTTTHTIAIPLDNSSEHTEFDPKCYADSSRSALFSILFEAIERIVDNHILIYGPTHEIVISITRIRRQFIGIAHHHGLTPKKSLAPKIN